MAFEQLDLQKTIDMNAQAGFRFVLRNEPIEENLKDHPDVSGRAGRLDSATRSGRSLSSSSTTSTTGT